MTTNTAVASYKATESMDWTNTTCHNVDSFLLVIWFSLLFLALVVLPLGIASILHCRKASRLRWPLTTKLLVLGGIWTLVIGLVGCVREGASAFTMLSVAGPNTTPNAMFACDISLALQWLLKALIISLAYLAFIAVSIVMLHRRQKDI